MNFKHLICILITIMTLSCRADNVIELQLGRNILKTEVVYKPEDRQKGLMNRKDLKPDHGMIFVFEKEMKVSFWMKNTSIPLSIAYINKKGEILELYDLKPYSLESVPSRRSSIIYALEVNRNYFLENNIEVGDYIDLEPLRSYLNSSR